MDNLHRIFGSDARLKILRLFLFNQEGSFSIENISERTKVTPQAARREVKELAKSSLIRTKKVRGKIRYGIDPRFSQLAALDRFIRDTTDMQPKRIVGALRRAGTLKLVVLSGFFTGLLEPKVDLLVVGDDLDDRILAQVVRTLEAELGREIRYAPFSTADFRYRKGVYDRLLRDVFDYPHRLLIDKIGI